MFNTASLDFHKNFVRPCEDCGLRINMKEMLIEVHEGDGYYNCPQCNLQIMRNLKRMVEKKTLHMACPDFDNGKELDKIREETIKPSFSL